MNNKDALLAKGMDAKDPVALGMAIAITICIPTLCYFFLGGAWLYALSILLVASFMRSISQITQLKFEKHCFLAPRTSPLMWMLLPDEIIGSKIDPVPFETKSEDIVTLKKSSKGKRSYCSYKSIVGYVLFEDGTREQTTKKTSLGDIKNSSSKKICFYIIATTNFRISIGEKTVRMKLYTEEEEEEGEKKLKA